jgi:hypothetical protein
MKNVAEQKVKLAQKKNRLIIEETRLKLLERKTRTRHLIELGGLVTKAGLEHLPTNTLYDALLSLTASLETNGAVKEQWTNIGKTKLDQEQTNKHPVILKFETQPTTKLRDLIRNHGLKWNKLRLEWYGHVSDIDALKLALTTTQHQIDLL